MQGNIELRSSPALGNVARRSAVRASGVRATRREGGEWRFYGADGGSTKYSALDQINRDNVKDLKIAWRWKTDNFGPYPEMD